MPVTIQCAYCGASKSIPPSQVKANKTGKFYCSAECHGLNKRDKIEIACKLCGNAVKRKPSNGGEFCSRACAMKWRWNHSPQSDKLRQQASARKAATSLKPERDALKQLHIEQALSAREIGEIYGVQSQTVRAWIRSYEIPFTSRPLRGTVAPKVITPTKRKFPPRPSLEELHNMIHVDRLIYEQIASKYNVDFTAVYYWMNKYKIERPKTWYKQHSDPDTVQAMQSAYESGLSLDNVGQMFGAKSRTMVAKVFRDHGVPIRKDGWDGGKRFACDDGHDVRSTYEQSVDNWLYKHGVEHAYEPQLPFSPTHKADFMANGWYIEVWGVNSNPAYKERKERKIDLYRAHLCPLIEIPYYAFAKSFNGLWVRRLEQCLQPVLPLLLSENIV